METLIKDLEVHYPPADGTDSVIELYAKKLSKVRLIAFPQAPKAEENIQKHFKSEDMLQYLKTSLRNLVVYAEKIGENNIEFLSKVIPLGMGEIRRTIMNSAEYILIGNKVLLSSKEGLSSKRNNNAEEEYEAKIKYKYICEFIEEDGIRKKRFVTEVQEDGAKIHGHPDFSEEEFPRKDSIKDLCDLINNDFGTQIETIPQLNEFLAREESKERIIKKLKEKKEDGFAQRLEKQKESTPKWLMRRALEIYYKKCPKMRTKFVHIMSIAEWKKGHYEVNAKAAIFDDDPAGEIYYDDCFQPYYIVVKRHTGIYLSLKSTSDKKGYKEFKLSDFAEVFPASERKDNLIRALYSKYCCESELNNIAQAAHLDKKGNTYSLSMEGDYEGLLLPYRDSKTDIIILKSSNTEYWNLSALEFRTPSYGFINIERPESKEIRKMLSIGNPKIKKTMADISKQKKVWALIHILNYEKAGIYPEISSTGNKSTTGGNEFLCTGVKKNGIKEGILRLIKNAKDYILVSVWILNDGEITDALKEAFQKRGVAVFIITFFNEKHYKAAFSPSDIKWKDQAKCIKKFLDAGIFVRALSRERWVPHAKFMIADNNALITSANFGGLSLTSAAYGGNYEAGFQTDDKAIVESLKKLFSNMYMAYPGDIRFSSETGGEVKYKPSNNNVVNLDGSILNNMFSEKSLKLIANFPPPEFNPKAKSDFLTDEIIKTINKAEKSLYLSTWHIDKSLSGHKVGESLKDASKRGAIIKICMPRERIGYKEEDMKVFEELAGPKLEVEPKRNHSKIGLAISYEGKPVYGYLCTSNLNPEYFDVNIEVGIAGDDKDFLNALKKFFEDELWKERNIRA